ncbi:MAG: dephospho-CoA kinase, partial [Eubacterium sp.]|nr:dephospho-CoA kinase [Eubacterium sp.]
DSLIHPFVLNLISEKIKNWKQESSINDPDLFIIETALMFETGCYNLCDKVIGITCDEKIRIKRLMETRGYTEEKTRAILHSQMSNEELTKRCDMIIDNSGTRNDLQINITNLMHTISQ